MARLQPTSSARNAMQQPQRFSQRQQQQRPCQSHRCGRTATAQRSSPRRQFCHSPMPRLRPQPRTHGWRHPRRHRGAGGSARCPRLPASRPPRLWPARPAKEQCGCHLHARPSHRLRQRPQLRPVRDCHSSRHSSCSRGRSTLGACSSAGRPAGVAHARRCLCLQAAMVISATAATAPPTAPCLKCTSAHDAERLALLSMNGS